MDLKIRIRPAKPEDAEKLLVIYAPYVEQTAITFEYEVPTVEEFRERIHNTLKKVSLFGGGTGWRASRLCLCGTVP